MTAPRINIRGISGSGKSTLSARAAAGLGVSHIELDALHHGPNWAEPTSEEFRSRVETAMVAAPHGWVVDGNYDRKLGSLVFDAAESVVWLDPPLHTALLRLWARTRHRIMDNVELWNGNRESWTTALWGTESLFAWTVRSYFRHRREWPARLAMHPGYVRLRTPADVQRWLQDLLGSQVP